MIEKNVKDKVKRIIKRFEEETRSLWWSYWPVQTGFGKHGIPDCLVCVNGWLVAIETKVDCKEPTTRQQHELESIQRSKGISLVIDQHNLQDVEDVFNALVRGDHSDAISIAAVNGDLYRTHVSLSRRT